MILNFITTPTGRALELRLTDEEVAKLKERVVQNPRSGGLQNNQRAVLVRMVANPPINVAAMDHALRSHVAGCEKRRTYSGPPRKWKQKAPGGGTRTVSRTTEKACEAVCYAHRRALADAIVPVTVLDVNGGRCTRFVIHEPDLIKWTQDTYSTRYGTGGFQNTFGGRARYGKCGV